MTIRRSALLVVALAAVATSLGGAVASATVAPATFVAHETGFGATLAAAEANARSEMNGDYGPCTGFFLTDDGQNASGIWFADMAANCTTLR
jgi:hypothetical protein